MATDGTNGTMPPKFSESSPVPLWLNGKQVTTSETFEVVSPLDCKVLYHASSASEEDALAAVDAAQKAFPEWSKTKPSHRRDLFLRAARIFEERKDEFWHYCHTETASNEAYFAFDHSDALEALKSTAGLITTVDATMPTVGEEGRSAIILHEPYGVVLSIAPWNCPTILGLRAFLGPLAMGNTVVFKGSEYSPGAFWALAEVFHQAGLPAGALNTVYHRPADAAKITSALIAAPAIKKINFTGSTAVGSVIASQAGKYLKPVLMELGGKAPAYVCEDADINLAALQCALGAFMYSGQVCMSTERILVHEKILEEFKPALKAAIDQVFAEGAPSELITAKPVERVKKLVDDALSKGAKLVHGDPTEKPTVATSMRPVVIEDVREGMELYHTESFGPTVALFVVKSDEEAIRIANDTEYGLASAVFTEDLKRGLRIAKQIETGAVHINSMSIHDEPVLPHGGAKKSGFGRFNGREGLREWTRTKVVTWRD